MKNNKGMTMIELLGVITLLGIILVVAVPNVYKYATGARNQSYDTMAKSLYEAAEAKFMDDGAILDVCVAEGQSVKRGECLCILDSMKMNNQILAPMDGKINKIFVEVGQSIGKNVVMVEFF